MIVHQPPVTPTKKELPENDLIELIKLVNGNPHGIMKIVTEFTQTYRLFAFFLLYRRPNFAKAQIERKIREIAVKEHRNSARV